MKEEETWRPVVGFEEDYQVSNMGRVKSFKFGKERVLRPAANNRGYLFVYLCKDGKKQMKTVHRLVAQAFLPNPKGLAEVNHIDEDKANNAVTNLEWCDRAYNCNFGTRNERVTAILTNGKCSKSVQQLTKTGKLVANYPSASEAARQTGWDVSGICHCCNGGFYQKGKWRNLHSYKNFKWRYE